MYEKKLLAIILCCAFFLAFSCLSINAAINMPPNHEELSNLAKTVSSTVQDLLEDDGINYADLKDSDEDFDLFVGNVAGQNITKKYFAQRVNMYKACGYNNPVDEAWQSIIREVNEYKFAEEHNLLPSENDILERVADDRAAVESDSETRVIVSFLLSEIGLTEDEYWEEYKPKYEMPVQLIKENIFNYLEENNLPTLDYSETENEIFDIDYYKSLES